MRARHRTGNIWLLQQQLWGFSLVSTSAIPALPYAYGSSLLTGQLAMHAAHPLHMSSMRHHRCWQLPQAWAVPQCCALNCSLDEPICCLI